MRTFLDCQKKYYWRYKELLSPKRYEQALEFGMIGHYMLSEYYKGRTDFDNIAEGIREDRLKKEISADGRQKFETALYAAKGMVTAYADFYILDKKEWDIVANEKEVQSNYTGYAFREHGIPDLVINKADGLFVVDHKFLSMYIPENTLLKLPLDHQAMLYTNLVSQELNLPVQGFIYNVILKSKKRLKKGQTLEQYQQELYNDYIDTPEKYFHRQKLITAGIDRTDFVKSIDMIKHNIRQSEAHETWIQNPSSCNRFGLCPFIYKCTKQPNCDHLYEKRERKTNEITNRKN